MLPSPNTKSQGAKNDSVFGKMKEFVRSLIFSIISGRARSIFHSDFLGKERKKNLLNQKLVFITYLYFKGYLSFSSFLKEVQREEITRFFVLFEL